MDVSHPAVDSVRFTKPWGAKCADRARKASKHSIQTGAGVIDADYRGPVMVLLFNHSDNDFEGESSSIQRQVDRCR